jgi:hypothetical protein
MLHRCCRARFALETRDGFTFLQVFVGQNIRPDCLDCHTSRHQILVASHVNLAHRAAAQTLVEPITTIQQGRARQGASSFWIDRRDRRELRLRNSVRSGDIRALQGDFGPSVLEPRE